MALSCGTGRSCKYSTALQGPKSCSVVCLADRLSSSSVGKLVKASNKRSTRDNMALNAPFATEMSLGLSSHASGTSVTATATTGTSKLSHAQAELQACELHLAAKERELENIREETLKKGLERRLKALVSCGWAWGERGKQALRALDGLRGDHTSKG